MSGYELLKWQFSRFINHRFWDTEEGVATASISGVITFFILIGLLVSLAARVTD